MKQNYQSVHQTVRLAFQIKWNSSIITLALNKRQSYLHLYTNWLAKKKNTIIKIKVMSTYHILELQISVLKKCIKNWGLWLGNVSRNWLPRDITSTETLEEKAVKMRLLFWPQWLTMGGHWIGCLTQYTPIFNITAKPGDIKTSTLSTIMSTYSTWLGFLFYFLK